MRRLRGLYEFDGNAFRRIGCISEARLRAWEYDVTSDIARVYAGDQQPDTVRRWRTRRPDLNVPFELWVGDREERVTHSPDDLLSEARA